GQQEAASKTNLPSYDPSCYLCPGNKRAQGEVNPKYKNTYVFVNDYSAIKEVQNGYTRYDVDGSLSSLLLRAEAVTGKCYVIAFAAAHDLTLADLSLPEILAVIDTWTEIYTAHISPLSPLSRAFSPTVLPPASHGYGTASHNKEQYRYMQIFENKGAAMGCSNPHPHGQIWTTSCLPEEPGLELDQLIKYKQEQGGLNMLEDYASLESEKKERLVFENKAFVAVCPWWGTWPFEVMIIARQHKRALVDLEKGERQELAEAIAEVTKRYDNLFETQFPYSMGVHQAPLTGTDIEINASHLHIHFFPPLLRSATVRKFLVGLVFAFSSWYITVRLIIEIDTRCWQSRKEISRLNKPQCDYAIVVENCIE
ncbi:galactose-1-phosphate uridyl transferase, partial [Xylographa opegraphella]|nr:galactose-1-phosphate uridyl transferase [Xylographa opegraphella]